MKGRHMKRKKKKIGVIHLHYYEHQDTGKWEIRVAVGKNDLPDPEVDLKSYVKMGLLTAQLTANSKEQILALDHLLVLREEFKKLADVDKYQTPLPFTEEPE